MAANASNRLIGIDFAYTIAVIGCVVYCLTFTIGDKITSSLSHSQYLLFFDVFPALFFFLNGLTVTLTMRDRKVSNRKLLSYLGKRGSVLLLVGLAVCIRWPMNIFIASGIFYVLAPYMAQWNSILLRIATFLVITVGLLLLFVDIPTSAVYTLPSLYSGEILGLVGFVTFNGFFSIFPWLAFFCAGLLHGRSDIRPKGWLPPSSLLGLLFVVGSFFIQIYTKRLESSADNIPRSDFFLNNIRLSYAGFIVYALGVCIIFTNAIIYFCRSITYVRLIKFVQTISSLKYSVLFFHTFIGILTLVSSNRPFFHKNVILVLYVTAATFTTIYLTLIWRKKVSEKGPMEWLIKRISGSSK